MTKRTGKLAAKQAANDADDRAVMMAVSMLQPAAKQAILDACGWPWLRLRASLDRLARAQAGRGRAQRLQPLGGAQQPAALRVAARCRGAQGAEPQSAARCRQAMPQRCAVWWSSRRCSSLRRGGAGVWEWRP